MKYKKCQKLGKIMGDSIIKGTEKVDLELEKRTRALSLAAIDIMDKQLESHKPDGRELKWVQGKPLGDCQVVITKCEDKGEEDGK